MACHIRNREIWESGELKIRWVRDHMPLLASVSKEFSASRPFAGLKVALSVHLEAKTAHLCEVLAEGGAEMYVTGSNPLSTQDDIAADAPSPATHLANEERFALLRHVIAELAPNDRQILTLRHFDGFSNMECAEILSIDPKAASIRYARALVRLRERLADYSEFKK